MSREAHRQAIVEALAPELPMVPLRRNDTFVMFVGLWAVWWVNGTEPSGMKVVLAHRAVPLRWGDPSLDATVPRKDAPVADETTLAGLKWVILQLQSLDDSDPVWSNVRVALDAAVTKHHLEQNNNTRCAARITYTTVQLGQLHRQPANPELLETYVLQRINGDAPTTPRPADGGRRRRIEYVVLRGRPDDLKVQPLRVFAEQHRSRRAPLSERMSTQTGVAKDTTMRAAVGEFRTWIVLTETAAGVP